MKLAIAIALWLRLSSAAMVFRREGGLPAGNRSLSNKTAGGTVALDARNSQAPTFQTWYSGYSEGRGIWKWNTALEAYQNHFGRFAGSPVSFLEIGVQSGGSIGMFKAVLGNQCHYYGMDINPKTTSFADAQATISILDQGDPVQWAHFFGNVVNGLDLLLDDGGHQSHQMLTTLQQALPHIKPGGVHMIEDIHGQNEDYLANLFYPAAELLASKAPTIAGVHMYPFVAAIQTAGGTFVPPAPVAAAATFSSIPDLVAAVPNYRGQVIHLANPAWPTMYSADGLKNLFSTFYGLMGGTVVPKPDGCFRADANEVQCTMEVTNSELQNLISHVDMYPSLVQVHVAAETPSITAVRKGNIWIPYGG